MAISVPWQCLAMLLLCLLLPSCGGGGSGPGPVPSTEVAEVEAQLHQALDELDTDSDFSLQLVAANGHRFVHNRGAFSPSTVFESASTSKWATAAVIMDLVDIGVLRLTDHPQDYLSFWPTTGNLSQITLRHLLSFTSGLTEKPLCVDAGGADFGNCVQRIAEVNRDAPAPGSVFYYGSSHMQVAGLMAVVASGVDTWAQVFDAFRAAHGLFANSLYDLPSLTNPRLAGGMHVRGDDYLAFLQQLYDGSLIDRKLVDEMERDQRGDAQLGYSPAEQGLGVDWHYGLGHWLECAGDSCNDLGRHSSPGAYGAYPFIDRQQRFYGILARQGRLGSYVEGYAAFAAVEALLVQWAQLNQ